MKRICLICVCLCVLAGAFSGCGKPLNREADLADIYTDASDNIGIPGAAPMDDALTSSGKAKTASVRNTAPAQKSSDSKKSTQDNKQKNYENCNIIPSKSNINAFLTVGRVYLNTSAALVLHWTCASVAFRLDCVGDVVLKLAPGRSGATYVAFYVDGKLVEPRRKIASVTECVVAKGLSAGVHTFKIVRQSDMDTPDLLLSGIRTSGILAEAPSQSGLYIECIGDSALTGCGVLLEDTFYKNEGFEQATAQDKAYENGMLTYPYLAAAALDADCYMMGRWGTGIVATYYSTTATVGGKRVKINNPDAGLLPTLYANANPPAGTTLCNAERKPDVILLDAGRTDVLTALLSRVRDNEQVGVTPARAAEITTEFFRTLHDANPYAKIVWCYGLTDDSAAYQAHVSSVMQALGGEETGCYYAIKMKASTCRGYPSAREYAAAAEILKAKLRAIV